VLKHPDEKDETKTPDATRRDFAGKKSGLSESKSDLKKKSQTGGEIWKSRYILSKRSDTIKFYVAFNP